jgi:hypothetical protein
MESKIIKVDYDYLTNTGWTIVTENTMPPLRNRVLVTDGDIVCIAWVNSYKKGFEGWKTIDNEYLNDIIAWKDLPTVKVE